MKSPRMKIDFFIPLEIGRYLQDTAHLSVCQSGAYLHLLMYYWAHGPLPNEMEQLANIARMPIDAWSITYASLKHFFSIGPDGLLHQTGADRRLEFWRGKKQKAHDKASKAARARWDKQKAKQGLKSDAPSITQALLEQCPISIQEEQKQEQKLPPTPTASRRGIEAAAQVLQATPPASSPRAPAGKPNGQAPTTIAQPEHSPAIAKSEHKEKRAETGAGALPNGRDDVSPVAGRPGSLAETPPGKNKGKNLGVRPSKTVQRANLLKSEVLAYWRGQNPKHPKCPWSEADDRALGALLRAAPDLTVERLHQLLVARAHSEVNPAALPHKWLRSIQEFSAGSLGKYGKPLSQARNF